MRDRTKEFEYFLSVALTCRKHNTDEWMEGFVNHINVAIASLGCDQRATWNGDGFSLSPPKAVVLLTEET